MSDLFDKTSENAYILAVYIYISEHQYMGNELCQVDIILIIVIIASGLKICGSIYSKGGVPGIRILRQNRSIVVTWIHVFFGR